MAALQTKHLQMEVQIELDVTEDHSTKSHALFGRTKGRANNLGHIVTVKPHIQIATRAKAPHDKDINIHWRNR